MDEGKCKRCQRRDDCPLRDMAALTLPWVSAALQVWASDWDTGNAVRRVLRGNCDSPGFVEDWMDAGAMTHHDLEYMVHDLIRNRRVELGTLCRHCRHYVGPELCVPEAAAACF